MSEAAKNLRDMQKDTETRRMVLKVGHPLADPVYKDNGMLFLPRGYVIRDDRQLEFLKAVLGYDKENEVVKAVDASEISPVTLLEDLEVRLEKLFSAVEKPDNFIESVRAMAGTLQYVCREDEDLALSSVMTVGIPHYTSSHPLSVGILSEITAMRAGWPVDKRLSLLCAALTMNVSMNDLQDKLLQQSGPLSPWQKREITRHPVRSAEMLAALGVKDSLWLEAVREHHEAVDGSGYPSGLDGSKICASARILAPSDVFCARVSGRMYRGELLPDKAVRELFLGKGRLFDNELTDILIKNLGIYPPGTFVRLANDEIAVVTRKGNSINTPIVYGIVKPNEMPMTPKKRDVLLKEYAIKEIVPNGKVNIPLNKHQLWGHGFFKKDKTHRRQYRRMQTNIPAVILNIETVKIVYATIVDISEFGCKLRFPAAEGEGLGLGKVYYLNFKLLGTNFENIACLLREKSLKNDEMDAGIQFVEITGSNKSALKNFLAVTRQTGGADE